MVAVTSPAPVSRPGVPGAGRSRLYVVEAPSRPGPQVAPVRLPAGTYRRRRAVAAGLVAALVLAVWAALGVFGGGPLPVPERPGRLQPGTTYVVAPGDTFWSIARRLDPGGDPRPLVDRLVAAHGGPTIHVGERIPLPSG